MKFFANLLASIDIFGVKQSFRIKNKETYGTCFGGFCVIAYLIIATIFLVNSLFVFIGKETFTLMTIRKAFNSDSRMNFSDHNFTIAMRIELANGTSIERTKYKDLFETKAILSERDNQKKNHKVVSQHSCTKGDFPIYANSTVFDRKPLEEMICFDQNDIAIFGIQIIVFLNTKLN